MNDIPQDKNAGLTELKLLIDAIERAFADLRYPGDDRISIGFDLDAVELQELFKGKHWSAVPVSTLAMERASLSFFTPEAFRFYLPAFLHAALLYPHETDTLRENLFSTLTPPISNAESIEWFREMARGLTIPQRQVIRSFIRSFARSEPYYSQAIRDRAMRYWFEEENPPK